MRARLLLSLPGVLTAVMLAAPSAFAQTTLPLESHRTFLRHVDPRAADAVPIELAALGIQPGDVIQITRLGFYRNGAPPVFSDNVSGLMAVFSASATLLPPTAAERVVDAIETGADFISPATCPGGVATDIAEDFQVSPVFNGPPASATIVQVPAGATHLFVAAIDCHYGDNDDPNGDFAVRISFVDIDGDGIRDDRDACLPSDIRSFVDAGSGSTSIANAVNVNGCTIQDAVNALKAGARSHGDYVQAIVDFTNALLDDDAITARQRVELINGAARSRWP